MNTTLIFVVAILATWRISALLCYDKILNNFRLQFMQIIDADTGEPLSFVGRILACFWCTTIVVALPVTAVCLLVVPLCPTLLLWPLAVSGGAIVVNYASRIAIAVER